MKELLTKKSTIWGLVILGLIIIGVAFTQVARAGPFHLVVGVYDKAPETSRDTSYPCSFKYSEDAVLIWNALGYPLAFSTGHPNGHAGVLLIDAPDVKRITFRAMNFSDDITIYPSVEATNKDTDFIINQIESTFTVTRRDGEVMGDNLRLVLQASAFLKNSTVPDPGYKFSQVWEIKCHTE